MKLLAIDTATEACSVALSHNGTIVSRYDICPQQHSQKLLPMVDEVLKEAGITLQNLDGLIYGRGPGSFTGVRIATGMIQGLALGSGLKVAGVSTLAAMAQQVIDEQGADNIVCAIDARMGEVYFARFKNVDNQAVLEADEIVCPPEHAASLLPESFTPAGTGWAAYPELSCKIEGDVTVSFPRAESMLVLGQQCFASGDVADVENIEPVYLRDKVTWKKLPGRE